MTGNDVVLPDGVDLPKLPASWQWVYLDGLLIRIQSGKNFRCDERPPTRSEYGIVKISAVTWGTYDESESKTITDNERVDLDHLIKPGDFLFSRANTIELVGACLIVPETRRRLLLSDKILRFEFAGDTKNWINWMLKSGLGRRQIETLSSGNQESMRNIGQAQIRRICVPVPPVNEQRRIVGKIEGLVSELDKGVEALTTAREQLNSYRQSVLKQAFEGRLTEGWRNTNRVRGDLLAAIQTERDSRCGNRRIASRIHPEQHNPQLDPQVPSTWRKEFFGNLNVELFDGPFGSHLKTSDYVGSGIRVIRLENIGYGHFIDERQSFVSNTKYEKIKRHTVAPGDIVFSSFVTDGIRATLVPRHIPFAVNKADCFGIRFLGTTMNQRFVELFLESRNAFKQVESMIHGVGRPRINTSQLKEIVLPVCSRKEQDWIVEHLESAFSEIDALKTDIDSVLSRLEGLRQSILERAFSGRLVDQDPKDEPASVLLERIRTEREGATMKPATGNRRTPVKNSKSGKKKAA